jgi:hypothetical protein
LNGFWIANGLPTLRDENLNGYGASPRRTSRHGENSVGGGGLARASVNEDDWTAGSLFDDQ